MKKELTRICELSGEVEDSLHELRSLVGDVSVRNIVGVSPGEKLSDASVLNIAECIRLTIAAYQGEQQQAEAAPKPQVPETLAPAPQNTTLPTLTLLNLLNAARDLALRIAELKGPTPSTELRNAYLDGVFNAVEECM